MTFWERPACICMLYVGMLTKQSGNSMAVIRLSLDLQQQWHFLCLSIKQLFPSWRADRWKKKGGAEAEGRLVFPRLAVCVGVYRG